MDSLSAHLVIETGREDHSVLAQVRSTVHDRFGIDHITVQCEPEEFEACRSRV
jgi:cobalt-zinc-cadmium efflux system protein